MSSRWATNPDEDREILTEKKRKKEDKRRQKEQRIFSQTAKVAELSEDNPKPTKQRRARSPEQYTAEGASLLTIPTFNFQPSGSFDQYEVLNKIEEGSYGYVSRARARASGEIVALKRLKIDHNNNDGFPVTGLREIQTLRACSHAHIVKLREVISSNQPTQGVYIVMDFVEHDLKTLLEDMSEPFLPSEVKTLMLQLCSAIQYLHSNWIMHRDLKTSNLLLNNRGEMKLADFGMARYTSHPPPKLTQLVVTLWYRSPELLLGADEYHFEVDIWSIGCIFAELISRDPIFQGKNEVSQLSAIFRLLGTPTKENWPTFRSLPNAKAIYPLIEAEKSQKSRLTSAKYPYLTAAGLELLKSLLALNPRSRPAASRILQHTYFKEDPRAKPKELFPTFPSKASQEKRRRQITPQAPDRGKAPVLEANDFVNAFTTREDEQQGGGFALRME